MDIFNKGNKMSDYKNKINKLVDGFGKREQELKRIGGAVDSITLRFLNSINTELGIMNILARERLEMEEKKIKKENRRKNNLSEWREEK